MLRLAALLMLLVACGAVAACGGKEQDKTKATTAKATSTPATPAPSTAACQKVKARGPRPPRKLPKPTLKLKSSTTYRAVVDTSCGLFTITLDVKRAPKTTASFVSLARQRFFDGLTFHRIVNGFVIQGGDPSGDGSGGPGYTTVERPPGDLRYTRGVVAMAKGQIEDPGTAGSQFFAVSGEDAQLPADYALLGTVSDGLDIVERIGMVPARPDTGQPVDPVVIRSIRIGETKSK